MSPKMINLTLAGMLDQGSNSIPGIRREDHSLALDLRSGQPYGERYNGQVQMEGNPPAGGPQQPPRGTLQASAPAAPRPFAAAASAAARVNNEPAAPLPAFAREMERKQQRQEKEMRLQAGANQAEAPKPVRAGAKVGRNDPCPCGSGKKYKKCHGVSA